MFFPPEAVAGWWLLGTAGTPAMFGGGIRHVDEPVRAARSLTKPFEARAFTSSRPGVSPNHLGKRIPPVATSKMTTSSRCFFGNTAPGKPLPLKCRFLEVSGIDSGSDTSARDHPFSFFFIARLFKWSISRIKSCERSEKNTKRNRPFITRTILRNILG